MRRRRAVIGRGSACAALAGLMLAVGSPPSVSAQTHAVAARPDRGGQSAASQQEQILEELKAIRQLLEKLVGQGTVVMRGGTAEQGTEPGVTLDSLPTEFMLGRADAPVTLIEFTDLQCPFCRQFRLDTFDSLKREFIDTGKVRFISRDLPLSNLHPLAMAAARASRCAGGQRRFWEMRHAILVNNERLTPDSFERLATDLRLDAAAFAACTSGSAVDAAIQADIDAAKIAGIDGTPVFVLGRTTGTRVEGQRIDGALPFAVFEAQINALLGSQK